MPSITALQQLRDAVEVQVHVAAPERPDPSRGTARRPCRRARRRCSRAHPSGPSSRPMRATAASTAARSVTSKGAARARPPRVAISFATASARSPCRSFTATAAPGCGERARDAGALVLPGAGHERDAAREIEHAALYFPLKLGSRFSKKARIASARVLARARHALRHRLLVQRLGQAHRHAHREHALRHLQRERRAGGEPRRPSRATNASSCASGTTRFTMPMRSASLRVEHVAEQRELLRLVEPDEPRQQPRAAEVDREPALHEDLREARALAGHDQVAAEREVEPRAHRHAVHLRDGGLRDLVQREPDPAEVMHLVELMARFGRAPA